MATTVGQHGVAAFVNPQNGQTGDATVVLANDNTMRTAYVSHDADPGIHVQSSTTASRPAAGTAGRKWMTIDAGVVKLWYDDGTSWTEISYIQSTGTSVVDTLQVTNNTTLGSSDTDTLTVHAGVDSDLVPAVDNTVDLGTSTKSWRDVNAGRDVNVGNDVNVDGDVTAASFIGSGAGLTGITAASVAAGTFGAGAFTFPSTLTVTSALMAASLSVDLGVRGQASTTNVSGSVSVGVGALVVREYVITGNTTFNLTNDSTSSIQIIVVRQNGTGGHTVTWAGTGVTVISGASQTATAGRASVWVIAANGANIYVTQFPGELTT